MTLEEAQARLKKTQINQDQLWALNSLYILLDLQKDDFCKIIDTVGIETLTKKQRHYDRLMKAEAELAAKEKYVQAKARLEELENEKANLEQIVNEYKPLPA
jgi:outer membrane PBP1 activator LpoA protein